MLSESGEGLSAGRIAADSHDWYRTAAIRSRRWHRFSELLMILVSATIPLAAIVLPSLPIVPAILGSVLVVMGGAKALFNWQENYLRFSRSRELVSAEHRRYAFGVGSYSDPSTRDEVLLEAVTKIEQDEMVGWLQQVAKPASQSTPVEGSEGQEPGR